MRRPRTQTSAPLATPTSFASVPMSVIGLPAGGRRTTSVIGTEPTTATTPRAVSDGAPEGEPLGGGGADEAGGRIAVGRRTGALGGALAAPPLIAGCVAVDSDTAGVGIAVSPPAARCPLPAVSGRASPPPRAQAMHTTVVTRTAAPVLTAPSGSRDATSSSPARLILLVRADPAPVAQWVFQTARRTPRCHRAASRRRH